ncbi:pyridoxamine 5'-phosphate oxidase [Eilatimonas milleporae]|uniref:Pyridoxine/pyridoxamine 5'-phosphate oxidase n=1 Tax=Eilatimonas milleporae TaxID=911205 RepID=A0A3M0CFN2_9PROT|nr:pyridoxamine 5'-phosphate oxidase [Eilatimonas milleporae]
MDRNPPDKTEEPVTDKSDQDRALKAEDGAADEGAGGTAPFSRPFDTFAGWFAEAGDSEPNDPNAMALATVAADGRPSLRMVLLKGWDEGGFVFYTNFESRKGRELTGNPHAALLFHWKSLRRQVRIEGAVTPVTDDEADAYFASRPRPSRIGAWASKQSRPLEGRLAFEAAIAKFTAQYAVGTVPRPPHWSGFRLSPDRFEFWQDRKFRLHDRHIYDRAQGEDGPLWQTSMLYP